MILSTATPALANMTGIAGSARSGCASCHGAELPTTQVCIAGLPADGYYDPGAAYDLEVTVDGTSIPPHGLSSCAGGIPSPEAGFNLEVGVAVGAACAGSAGSPGTLATEDAVAVLNQERCAEATHQFAGNRQTSWVVTWSPPATGDDVFFFAAGNAVDGNCKPVSDFTVLGFPPIGDIPNRLGTSGDVRLSRLPDGVAPSPERITVCSPALPAH